MTKWTDEDVKQVADRLEASDGLDFEVLARLVLDAVPAVPLREYEALFDIASKTIAAAREAYLEGTGESFEAFDDALGIWNAIESSRAGRTEG